TPHPTKRRRQEHKPAEHKKPKKAAVSSRALELHKREMQSYSVTVLFVLLASLQAQPAQPAQPVVLSDDDDDGEKEVTPAETGASGKRYISLDLVRRKRARRRRFRKASLFCPVRRGSRTPTLPTAGSGNMAQGYS